MMNLFKVRLIFVTIFFIFYDKLLLTTTGFKIYWNVPTFMCHRYGFNFSEISKSYLMTQNPNDEFTGSEIIILYDPGDFPAYFKIEKDIYEIVNGRVPQKGNLSQHLNKLQIDLDEKVPLNFSGIGILDYEKWRPIFRQNFNRLLKCRTYSIEIERDKFPILTKEQATAVAEKAFEFAGRTFFEETFKFIKQRRPFARWGVYDYPKCYNFSPKSPKADCNQVVKDENDKLKWFYDQSDVLFPSIYIAKWMTPDNVTDFIEGRVKESKRIAAKYTPPKEIYPYLRFKYKDEYSNEYISEEKYAAAVNELMALHVNGFVFWGSSEDVNTKQKCDVLLQKMNYSFGPIASAIIKVM